ncbi:LURP-one-related family protein [Luteolibacter pohnpeiensis]|uniref:LURP-one-related family protein n=1 Tax=Luteolibacter pohnpeiensis TaxID=454153 RepID=A0A934VXN3_9BACT|nr:LURP-one-related family protein [Luteolibacter pohnpeiensis]MBK1884555.1 LURP-one-related family protein [Luteolibacter pohnpeiensis]
MRYILKQKLWSFGDDFIIRDDQENDCYRVDGKAFSFGDHLTFEDMAGRELAAIRERLFTWGKTYEIIRPGQPVTTVEKEMFTFFSCKFSVDGPGDLDYVAEGDFMDHEYKFKRHGRTVAIITKRWFSWSDHYGIEIADGEDVVSLLATAVVIDLICHDNDD